MNNEKEIGVIIGRFQVHQLHPGHIDLISHVQSKHNKVIVFLGVSPALVTRKNPLDFVTRKELLTKEFPGLTVLSLPDMPDDYDWSKELDKRIREVSPIDGVVLYGSRDSFIPYYHGVFETVVLPESAGMTGTNLRIEVSKEVKSSPDFRAGVIYAAFNQYPKIFPTVDVAVIRDKEVLLARKAHEKKFRFIGGYTDPADNSFEEAAKREVREEAAIEIENIRYIASHKIDDWRYRGEEDKIITHLFAADYVSGEPRAEDDVVELKWISQDQLTEDQVVDEHLPLLHSFLSYFQLKNLNRSL